MLKYDSDPCFKNDIQEVTIPRKLKNESNDDWQNRILKLLASDGKPYFPYIHFKSKDNHYHCHQCWGEAFDDEGVCLSCKYPERILCYTKICGSS